MIRSDPCPQHPHAGAVEPGFDPPAAAFVESDVARALAEDIGSGDATADLLPDVSASACVVCKDANAVIAGRPWFDAVFRALDPAVSIDWCVREGDRVAAGEILCRLFGRTRALLSGERTALNFLQTLSATATVTAAYVDAVRGSGAAILDTRKTLPGLRLAQKYAVRVGGGRNHRIGLYDAMMLKENHILAAGSLPAAVTRARAAHPQLPLIVEVETLDELDQALVARPDRILLDEFSRDDLHMAVRRSAGRVPLEVSGGVGLDGLRELAETGVDCISIGALTKHVHAIDLSMRFEAAEKGSE
jgi:nicotinate-nucleotide pyrophosphorylase (carboxylating)